ncbi:MAG: patatin-like phospholipase family protein [Rubrimonas sp.]|uniref:patatin-like phospholipase family protein n=1 Tax=Rubrimonas sp. TaxID=2036015 RepID=UPI002FDC86DB
MTVPTSAPPSTPKPAPKSARKPVPKSAARRKQINLALQGGGSHGAFTWGVLDRLLEDDRLQIVAISGTSAGAMNAVVTAQGMQADGPAGARAALAGFWRQVARAAAFSPIRRSPLAVLTGDWKLDDSVGYLAADLLGRLASPYDLNPLGANPLRDLLLATVDFDRVRACRSVSLHISATDVETGRGRVFHSDEVTLDVVLASACLPSLFHAVEIEGRHYWDGGFMGNPVIWPFYESSPSDDVVIVQINPVVREGVPRSAREIADRVNEITFNGALLKELRAIDFVKRLIAQGRLSADEYRDVRLHMIEARKQLRPLGASSKLNAEWPFLKHLFGIGRDAAEKWLAAHFDDLGARQSLDVRGMLGG